MREERAARSENPIRLLGGGRKVAQSNETRARTAREL